jgi:hypothetical protein
MDIKQLRYFIAIAEEGSLSAASQRLRVARPSSSRAERRVSGPPPNAVRNREIARLCGGFSGRVAAGVVRSPLTLESVGREVLRRQFEAYPDF